MSASARMNDMWKDLQPREKTVILSGVALILLAAVYLVFSAHWETRAALVAEKERQVEQLAWLGEQVELAASLSNNCLDDRILPMDNREALNLLAERNRIDVLGIDGAQEADVRLNVHAVNGNSILRFLHQSACQGFLLQELTVTDADDRPGVLGMVEVRREI